MFLEKVLIAFKFDDGTEGVLQTTDEAIEYFGISVVVPEDKLISRKGYTYYRISGNDLKEVHVPPSEFYHPPKLNRHHVRRVKVPREEFTEKGNPRTFSFSFPKGVKTVYISYWLSWNITKHKPLYFLTESGKMRPVWDFSKVISRL